MAGRLRPTLLIPIIIGGAVLTLSAANGMSEFLPGSDTDQFRCTDCNIVYISAANLMPGHMSMYGYHRNTTPTIDRLAEEAIVFEEAYAQESHTRRAMTSTLTSLYPSQHHINTYVVNDRTLPRNITLAQQVLRRNGYKTYAAVQFDYLGSNGVSRGFDAWKSLPANQPNRTEEHAVLDNLLQDHGSGPFLLYYQTHLLHPPTFPPSPYSRLFNGTNETVRSRIATHPLLQNKPTGERYQALREDYLKTMNNHPEWRTHFTAAYDGTVRQVDDRVEMIVNLLKHHGMIDNTLIIVNAPHGRQQNAEPIGDDTGIPRAELDREEVHVPLIIRLPNRSRQHRVTALVENIDIWPTLLDMVGARHTSFTAQSEGISLRRLLRTGHHDKPFLLAELPTGEKAMTIVESRMRYYYLVSGPDLVYNWTADPEEKNPVQNITIIRRTRDRFTSLYRDALGRDPIRGATEDIFPYYAK